MQYLVMRSHQSEYPHPIQLKQGDALTIGDTYVGPEGWTNWFFCATATHEGGWVPEQLIARGADGAGYAREDYDATELNVQVGDTLTGVRQLNGWVWCIHNASAQAGWVPQNNLHLIAQ